MVLVWLLITIWEVDKEELGVLISSLQKIGGIEGHDGRLETALARGTFASIMKVTSNLMKHDDGPTNERIFEFEQAEKWKIKYPCQSNLKVV